jgi:putrescine transport system substrate-binding protein
MMKKYLGHFRAVGAGAGRLWQKGRATGSGPGCTAPAASAPASPPPAPAEEKVLNIYNWPDYMPEGMIAAFEKETGIKVNYDTFETNEALHAKLVAGNTGYDIVVPGGVCQATD